MRQIKTFILRLYVDTERREQTCGDLRPLPGRKPLCFKNKNELLLLVDRLASEAGRPSPEEKTAGEDE